VPAEHRRIAAHRFEIIVVTKTLSHANKIMAGYAEKVGNVRNAAQVDGYAAPALPMLPKAERISYAEAVFAALGADIRHGGNRACYVRNLDLPVLFIGMPVQFS